VRFVRLAALTLLLAALVALSGCGSGGESTSVTGDPIGFEQLAAAGQDSADAESGRFAFSFETTLPGATKPFAFSGEGAFDAASERSSLSLDLASFAEFLAGFLNAFGAPTAADAPDFGDPSLWQIDAVLDGTVVYMRFGAVSEQLPAGKSWVRSDSKEAGKGKAFDFDQIEQFTNNDPRKLVEILRAASGDIETAGTEELRGVTTTHYRATVDLAEYKKLVPRAEREELQSLLDKTVEESTVEDLPVDVWLDERGLVRKVSMSVTAEQAGATEAVTGTIAFELWDYGEDLEIDLPPADEVIDASAIG
jgi:hypothetical protein